SVGVGVDPVLQPEIHIARKFRRKAASSEVDGAKIRAEIKMAYPAHIGPRELVFIMKSEETLMLSHQGAHMRNRIAQANKDRRIRKDGLNRINAAYIGVVFRQISLRRSIF